MWATLLGQFFQSLFSAFQDWFREEQEVSTQWAAEARKAQLESLTQGLEREKQLQKEMDASVEKSKTFTIDDWMQGKTLLLILALLPLSGCFRFYVYTRPYQPVPAPLPERPAFDMDPDQDGIEDPPTEREMHVIRYAAVIESAYNRMREEIAKQNVEGGYPDTTE